VAGLNGGHKKRLRVGSLTKTTWRDKIWEGALNKDPYM
jgi:hypothetical protein